MRIIDRRSKRLLVTRLKTAGIPIKNAAQMVGLCRNEGYNNCERESLTVKGLSHSLRRIDEAEKLIEQGYPLDLIVQLTGVSGVRILHYMEDKN